MARKLRLEFAGTCYHVVNRGNYRRDLFAGKGAAMAFERCLLEAGTAFGWRLHAFIMMSNHFHLAVETPEPNLSDDMKWLQGTWAARFNRFRGVTISASRFHIESRRSTGESIFSEGAFTKKSRPHRCGRPCEQVNERVHRRPDARARFSLLFSINVHGDVNSGIRTRSLYFVRVASHQHVVTGRSHALRQEQKGAAD